MTDLSGQTFGKYQLIQRLGRGGMADVYRGYQPALDRHVAVKVLHPHLSEETNFIARFEREAKAVARLRHQHIVQVYDYDVQGEYYYMVMEYIEGGRTLKGLLTKLHERGKLMPIGHALSITSKLADALAYAHGERMIHRDIKPANVLLRAIDDPVLTDFGIARLVGLTGLTHSGAMIGTPAYMSPEQGRGEQADERSDIYALGSMLYEMLTGQPPYDAETPYAIILKHINDPLRPPTALVPSIPDEVERIVLKSLAKDPKARFRQAGGFANALKSVLSFLDETLSTTDDAGSLLPAVESAASPSPRLTYETLDLVPPVADVSPSEEEQLPDVKRAAARFRGRRSCWFWAIVLLVASLLIGGAIAIALLSVGGNLFQSAQSHEADDLASQGYGLLEQGQSDEALALFEQASALDPENASAATGMAMIYLKQGRIDEAWNMLQVAQELEPDDLLMHFTLGFVYSIEDGHYNPEAAVQEFTATIERCGDQDAVCASAYAARADVYAWSLDNTALALVDMDMAIGLEPDAGKLPELYAKRAAIHEAAANLQSAMMDYEQAFLLGGPTANIDSAVRIAIYSGQYAHAADLYRSVLQHDPDDAHATVGLGYALLRGDDLEGAQAAVQAALTADPASVEALYLSGLILLASGSPEEAQAAFEAVLVAPPEDYNYPIFNPGSGHEIHYDAASAAYDLGDEDRALELLAQSLEYDASWPQPYMFRARIFTRQGDTEAALQDYLAARELAQGDETVISIIDQRLAELNDG